MSKISFLHILDFCDSYWTKNDLAFIQKGREEKILDDAGEDRDVYISLVRRRTWVCFIASNEDEIIARLSIIQIMTS